MMMYIRRGVVDDEKVYPGIQAKGRRGEGEATNFRFGASMAPWQKEVPLEIWGEGWRTKGFPHQVILLSEGVQKSSLSAGTRTATERNTQGCFASFQIQKLRIEIAF